MIGSERRLVILRHSKSDWSPDQPDLTRRLDVRGRRDAPAVGRWLRTHVGGLDAVVCSPATRTRETWELASSLMPSPPEPVMDERVYDATAGTLLDVVHGLPEAASTVLLIGHNPAVHDLTVLLACELVPMATSTVAVLTWPGSWTDVGAIPATLQAHESVRG